MKLIRLLTTTLTLIFPTALSSPTTPSFNWSSITPSADIDWHPCYASPFQCARLSVPLDYLNTSSSSNISLAIIKLPAQVPDSSPLYAGPIFTNPGGPGNSGVPFLLRFGRHLQQTVDKPQRRHYDIVSWDPRGIGQSTPRVDCFHGNLLARHALALENRGTWGLDRGESALTYSLAVADTYGRRCEDSDRKYAGDLLPFVGSASVARDIVEMADRMEEERRGRLDEQRRIELKRSTGGDDTVRVQYIGFSYGTVLGHYLAALFPGRLGRIVLDGVCDVQDYANGPGWLSNLLDTDELFTNFLDGCHLAGPSTCSLALSSDSSASILRSRVLDYLSSLDRQPVPILRLDGSSVIVSGNDVRTIVGYMLYKPLTHFRLCAEMLSSAMDGNLTMVLDAMAAGGHLPVLQDSCPLPGPDDHVPVGVEGLHAVVCSDGDDVTDKEVSWWSDYVNKQLSLSSLFGAYWSTLRFACSGWRFQAKWSFKGPFTTPAPDPALTPGRPAAPLLFLSNRLDPVTPLANARAMAANHPGAGLVVQEALGHSALISAPSRCVATIVADYFDHGTVPDSAVSCEPNCGPWDPDCDVFKSNDHDEAGLLAQDLIRQDQQALRLHSHPLGIS